MKIKMNFTLILMLSVTILWAAAANAAKEDPPPPERVICGLEVGGRLVGYFTDCSGVGSESEVIKHRVVDNNGNEVIRKIPGANEWDDIVLKRRITSNKEMWNWRDLVVTGNLAAARDDAILVIYDTSYAVIARWAFTNAWPSKVSGPGINSDSEFGVEEITIVHEGMIRLE